MSHFPVFKKGAPYRKRDIIRKAILCHVPILRTKTQIFQKKSQNDKIFELIFKR